MVIFIVGGVYMSNFSNMLLSLRKDKNLTMVKLSEQSNLSQSYISQLENDRKKPTTEAIKSLASGLATKNKILDLQEQKNIEDELFESKNLDDLKSAMSSLDSLFSRNDDFSSDDDEKFRQIYVDHLNKAVDERFIELSTLFEETENEKHFTLYGEPLSDREKWVLKNTLLGIKESRNNDQ